MSITTDNLAEFVDRLADLKRALAQLNDAGTADRHLIGLETVANAARALFDDDKQTTALRLFANPSSNADMEPMLETGNGGYAYMDELAKYRIYGLQACEVAAMRLLKKCKKETLIMLCNDFGIPTSGNKEKLAEEAAEQLHYETDDESDDDE